MSLVEVKQKEIFCDSSTVARKFGIKHNDVTRSIKKVIPNIEDFRGAGCTPKIETEDRVYRGRKYTAYLLNKDAFTIVMMRFDTKRARQWQGKFIGAFNAMEQALAVEAENRQDSIWIENRTRGKQIRLGMTDVVKDFVDYATHQGSKSAKFYYKHLTNACYRALGLLVQRKPKLRDTLDVLELAELQLMEHRAGVLLRKYMDLERNYKDIYKCVKDELVEFGEILLIT